VCVFLLYPPYPFKIIFYLKFIYTNLIFLYVQLLYLKNKLVMINLDNEGIKRTYTVQIQFNFCYFSVLEIRTFDTALLSTGYCVSVICACKPLNIKIMIIMICNLK
jgi:hypothetical protein